MHEREHARDIKAADTKTLDFSPLTEFLLGTMVSVCIGMAN